MERRGCRPSTPVVPKRIAHLSDFSQNDFDQIASELNNRSRKILGYRTPAETTGRHRLTDVSLDGVMSAIGRRRAGSGPIESAAMCEHVPQVVDATCVRSGSKNDGRIETTNLDTEVLTSVFPFSILKSVLQSDVDVIFRALADPTRRSILERLDSGPRSVSALAEPFDVSLTAITQHVRVLERAALVTSTKDGRQRICTLERPTLELAEVWLAERRRSWDRRLDAREEHLPNTNQDQKDSTP